MLQFVVEQSQVCLIPKPLPLTAAPGCLFPQLDCPFEYQLWLLFAETLSLQLCFTGHSLSHIFAHSFCWKSDHFSCCLCLTICDTFFYFFIFMTLYDVANCLNLAQQNAPVNYPTQDGHAALALIGLYR